MSPVGLALSLALVVIAGLAAAVIRLVISQRRVADELAATRRLFPDCMKFAPFCAYIKDADGRYLYENPALTAAIRDVAPHITSFLGRNDRDIFPAEQARRYMDNDREVLRHGKPLTFDEASYDADGTVRQWFTMKFPWVDEQGRDCVAGMSVDLSELRQAQATAQASADRCSLALEAGRMGTLTMDLATRMLDTSPLFATLHGRPETKTHLSLAESLAEVHPDDRQSIVDAVTAALRNRAPSRITYRVVKPDGGVSWIELMGQVFTDDTGRPTIVRAVGFDVTERQVAYEELARRKAILRRLIEVQENERQTLCHELHDGMMQYAIGATMLLEVARDEAESPAQAARIATALDSLNRGIAEGRQVIRGVRSAVLDDLGLAAAIQDLADQMANAGVTVHAELDDGLDELPAALQTIVYRVVQESLSNVRKHAGTDRATVEVRCTPTEVHVRVCDDGKGFDVDEGRKHGFGIVGMTERVRLVGGACAIASRPDAGSRVDVRLPVPAAGTATTDHVATGYAAADPGFLAR